MDQPSAREHAEGPPMTDLEQQLTDHLRRRAASATPRYDLEGIEQATSVVSLVELDDRRPRRRAMRTMVGLAAVATAAAVIAIAVVTIPSDKSKVATPAAKSGPTTLAQGEGQFGTQTLKVTAEEQDGKVSGEFRVNNVVVTLQCAGTGPYQRELRL